MWQQEGWYHDWRPTATSRLRLLCVIFFLSFFFSLSFPPRCLFMYRTAFLFTVVALRSRDHWRQIGLLLVIPLSLSFAARALFIYTRCCMNSRVGLTSAERATPLSFSLRPGRMKEVGGGCRTRRCGGPSVSIHISPPPLLTLRRASEELTRAPKTFRSPF